jgi:hypothetical protein
VFAIAGGDKPHLCICNAIGCKSSLTLIIKLFIINSSFNFQLNFGCRLTGFKALPSQTPERCASPFRAACCSTKLLNFDIMEVQVDIGFDQLLKIVKKLPSGQLKQLKAEIEKEAEADKTVNLEALLLNGPTATKKQLDTIAKNRKAINQWRTK